MERIEIDLEDSKEVHYVAQRVQLLLDRMAMGGIDSDATREEMIIWIATGATVQHQRQGDE